MINLKEAKWNFLKELSNKNLIKILDLGCGKGFMSKFFKGENVKIVGIDIKESLDNSGNFNFIRGDIRKEGFGKENDLVIASLILHFFEKEEALQIIERAKNATSNLGYNFLICMSNKDKLAEGNPKKFYPPLEEIKEIYKNWILIKEVEDFTEIEDHDNLGPHQHGLILVLFQKREK
jgi:SAM-dependent methyltransferase